MYLPLLPTTAGHQPSRDSKPVMHSTSLPTGNLQSLPVQAVNSTKAVAKEDVSWKAISYKDIQVYIRSSKAS